LIHRDPKKHLVMSLPKSILIYDLRCKLNWNLGLFLLNKTIFLHTLNYSNKLLLKRLPSLTISNLQIFWTVRLYSLPHSVPMIKNIRTPTEWEICRDQPNKAWIIYSRRIKCFKEKHTTIDILVFQLWLYTSVICVPVHIYE